MADLGARSAVGRALSLTVDPGSSKCLITRAPIPAGLKKYIAVTAWLFVCLLLVVITEMCVLEEILRSTAKY